QIKLTGRCTDRSSAVIAHTTSTTLSSTWRTTTTSLLARAIETIHNASVEAAVVITGLLGSCTRTTAATAIAPTKSSATAGTHLSTASCPTAKRASIESLKCARTGGTQIRRSTSA